MVNRGYQNDDKRMFDYQLWELDYLLLRGPAIDTAQPYFTTIGAAQAFGRFTDNPFPTIISRNIGLPALNLGMSGAGPSFFLERPELIDRVNHGKFAVVQMFSGRSISNRFVATGANQGTAIRRSSPDARPEFAEPMYKRLLEELTPHELVELRTENRLNYITEMRVLLNSIRVPKILLYWSTHKPDYKEGLRDIGAYWGAFPHFINQEVIDALAKDVEHVVQVVSSDGLPQPLHDKETGEAVEMWPEDRFPGIIHRTSNLYYPSPQMHATAAEALIPVCRGLAEAMDEPPRSSPADPETKVLVHFQISENSGSAIDRSLEDSFGAHWHSIDPTDDAAAQSFEHLDGYIRQQRMLAISSHQLRFPFNTLPQVKVFPVVMLRHPVLRARAMYEYQRIEDRVDSSTTPHTIKANELDFPAWISWCLSHLPASGPIANYQTRVCSLRYNGRQPSDWHHAVTIENLDQAIANLQQAQVGMVEDFERSILRIERALKSDFPQLTLLNHAENPSESGKIAKTWTIAQIEEQLGRPLYIRLCEANQFDLLLYERFRL